MKEQRNYWTRREWLERGAQLLSCSPFALNLQINPNTNWNWNLPSKPCAFVWSPGALRHRQPLQSPQQDLNRLKTAYRKWVDPQAGKWGSTTQVQLHSYWGNQGIHERPLLFFYWHRAFLYFHERNLASALGPQGSAFALPFWNWDLKSCRDQSPFCAPPPDSDVMNLLGNLNWPAMSNLSVDDLGSLLSMSWPQFAQALIAFHSSAHSKLGGDFSTLDSSAGSPAFYLFHANFDRIFAAYQIAGAGKANIPTLNRNMFFFDQQTGPNGSWVGIKSADLLAVEQMGYTYDFPPDLGPTFNITEASSNLKSGPGSRFKVALDNVALPHAMAGRQLSVLTGPNKVVIGKIQLPSHTGHHDGTNLRYALLDVTDKVNPNDFLAKRLTIKIADGNNVQPVAPTSVHCQVWTRK